MDERVQAIEKVNAAIPPLKRIDELYAMATNLTQQTTALQTSSKAKKSHHGTIIGGLAAYVAGQFMAIIINGVLAVTGSPVLGFIGIVAAIFLCIWVYKKVKQKLNEDDIRTVERTQKDRQTIEKISSEIEQIAVSNADAINEIPRDYRTYYAVSFFDKVLENGRAESMKEAMNLYEDHLHKMRMENMNQQLIYRQNQQVQMLAEVERNTRETKRAVDLNTAFNVLQYITR